MMKLIPWCFQSFEILDLTYQKAKQILNLIVLSLFSLHHTSLLNIPFLRSEVKHSHMKSNHLLHSVQKMHKFYFR